MVQTTLHVHNYRDYRDFLGDWFRAAKTWNRQVSFRYVARRLGLKSPNHFHLVITKQRHLSAGTYSKMHKLLKLKPKERTYLDLLHGRAMEKSEARRQDLDDKLARLNAELLASDVSTASDALLSSTLAWYMKGGALRFNGKTEAELFAAVRQSCPFPVEEADVSAALEALQRAKAVTRQGETFLFEVSDDKTEWDFDDQKIKQFHYNNLKLAMQAIPWPIDQRFFSNVTIPCDREIYEVAKKEIRDLCLKLLNISNSRITAPADCTDVVSLQFAMFPYFRFGQQRHDQHPP